MSGLWLPTARATWTAGTARPGGARVEATRAPSHTAAAAFMPTPFRRGPRSMAPSIPDHPIYAFRIDLRTERSLHDLFEGVLTRNARVRRGAGHHGGGPEAGSSLIPGLTC